MSDEKFLNQPCVRQSLINGITGGVFVGLAHFALTSQAQMIHKVALGGYLVISLGSYGFCRYRTIKEAFVQHYTELPSKEDNNKTNLPHNPASTLDFKHSKDT